MSAHCGPYAWKRFTCWPSGPINGSPACAYDEATHALSERVSFRRRFQNDEAAPRALADTDRNDIQLLWIVMATPAVSYGRPYGTCARKVMQQGGDALHLRTQDTRLPCRFLTSLKPSRCSLAAYFPERRPAVLHTSGKPFCSSMVWPRRHPTSPSGPCNPSCIRRRQLYQCWHHPQVAC